MSYQISPDGAEKNSNTNSNLSIQQHFTLRDKVPCLRCGSRLKKPGTAHLFEHMITHASTRQFRCSKCDTTNHKLCNFKKHRKKCRGATIDAIDSEMIEEWRQLINKCYPQHSAKMHDYLQKKILKKSAPKTPKNTKPMKKREEQRKGSLEKYVEQFGYTQDGSFRMSDVETSESTAIPVEAVEISMPQLSLLRQDVIKDEDWKQRTESLSNASSTSTSEEQNSQLVLIIQKLNDENRLLREERKTRSLEMAKMERTLAGKCMETSQLREEKIASDAQREAQFRALQNEILMLKAQSGTKGMIGKIPCVQLD